MDNSATLRNRTSERPGCQSNVVKRYVLPRPAETLWNGRRGVGTCKLKRPTQRPCRHKISASYKSSRCIEAKPISAESDIKQRYCLSASSCGRCSFLSGNGCSLATSVTCSLQFQLFSWDLLGRYGVGSTRLPHPVITLLRHVYGAANSHHPSLIKWSYRT